MLKFEGYTQDYKYIVDLLCNKRLKEGIDVLKVFLSKTSNWELQNALSRVEESYTYMLDYMRQDIGDPKRKDLQCKLLRDALAIADQGLLAILSAVDNAGSYFDVMRSVKVADPSQTLLNILLEVEAYSNAGQPEESKKHHEELQGTLFKTVWGSPVWSAEEESITKQILESDLVPVNDKCLLVAAVTISLMECFNIRKILFLFDAYNHDDNKINQRALVGLAIAFQCYHRRMPFYPKIISRLTLLAEDGRFASELNRVQVQLLRSKETEKITKRMQEEIIPEMLKNVNEQKMRINPDDHEDESNDANPDWMRNLEDSPLADKLREMTELQMEGADVYMGTFSALKSFPFFREIQNWFYPFDKQHSAVEGQLENGTTGSRFLDAILSSPFFCDSDKYSFSHILSQIPAAQREYMVQQMLEQSADQLMEGEHGKAMSAAGERPDILSNLYIQNLYRFFKLYSRHYEFRDIFKETINLNIYPVLKEVLYKAEWIKPVVEFYFNNHHYAEAIELYRELMKLEGESAETFQKIGYCYQKRQMYKEAIQCFRNADLFSPDNVWTNRHLAICYRMLASYSKAVYYYQKVEEAQPENNKLLFNIGSCLVELGKFDQALRYFFKLDYIDPDNMKTWRAIAWCSFVQGKLDQAMKYYQKILETKGIATDYLNAGHVTWCMGNMKEAIALYKEAFKLSDNAAQFQKLFDNDKEYLLANGIDEYDIALVSDLIQ